MQVSPCLPRIFIEGHGNSGMTGGQKREKRNTSEVNYFLFRKILGEKDCSTCCLTGMTGFSVQKENAPSLSSGNV